ncbi:MAG TPA: hypothetical protein VEJ63_07410, partial [Planctomycetota bacterium]|nr:hypothetical protein [Planctomycetota bacterium]
PGAGGTATVQCGKPISFVKDKNYYFGVWARCENVTRRTWRYHMPWALQGISARITLSGSPLLFPEHDPNFDKNYLIRLMDDRDWFCYEANALSTLCTPRPALNTVSSTLALTINQENMPYLDAGKPARVWLDEILAFEQPQVQISWERISKKLVPDGFFFYRRAATCLNPSLYDLPQLDAPRPYERIEKISDTAAQAERKTLTLGIHTSKAIAGLQLDVSDLKGPNGAVLGEKQREIEFTYVPSQNFKSDGNGLEGWVIDGNAPREIDRPGYVDYLISFYVPADAAPGKYAGTIKVKGNGTELGSVPVELEIANLRLKPVTEQFAGLIYNAGCGPERLGVEAPWKDANWLKYYSRCNFSYMMNFCQFVPFKGESHEVDIPALVAAVKEVRDLGGCTAGVGLYADCSLDKMGNNNGPEGGRGLWTRSGRNPDVYRARVKEMNDALTKESLPKLMYMIYDEPRFCDPAKFGILKDVPGAVTTSDINFRECLESMEKGLFTHAAVDGPGCDYGPAFRKFATKCNVKTGWDTQFGPLCNRYQTGLMLSNGASIISCWHAAYYIAWHSKLKCYVRNQSIVGAGEGMIDFRYFLTLQESIAEAKKKNAAKAEVEAAEKYIKEIQSFCGDDFHFMGAIEIFTYNGSPEVWGDDWFYDRWRSEMRRHTLAINAKLSGAAAKPQNGPKTAGR